MLENPRTWKWAVPAAIFVILIPVTGIMLMQTSEEMQIWAIIPMGFACLALVMAMVNLWRLVTMHWEDMYSEHQAALSRTPLVMLAENMKQMHPEAVRVLNKFGVRTSWQVRVDANRGTRDWTLADTNVHFGFIEFVISKSGTALYPKNRFSEGSKKWDPDGIMEDREQYDELERWLFSRLMVTRSHGDYKPAEFIPPWRPELILEVMGLSGEQELYKPEETNLTATPLSSSTTTSPQMAPAGRNLGGEGERELTEEETQAIEVEMVRNASQYKGV